MLTFLNGSSPRQRNIKHLSTRLFAPMPIHTERVARSSTTFHTNYRISPSRPFVSSYSADMKVRHAGSRRMKNKTSIPHLPRRRTFRNVPAEAERNHLLFERCALQSSSTHLQ